MDRYIGGISLLLLFLILFGCSGVVSAQNNSSNSVTVEIRPSEQEWNKTEYTRVEMYVTNADEGIGAYELNLSLTNLTVARIHNFTVRVSGGASEKEIGDDGSFIYFADYLGSNTIPPSQSVHFLTFYLKGKNKGTTGFELKNIQPQQRGIKSFVAKSGDSSHKYKNTYIESTSNPEVLGAELLILDTNLSESTINQSEVVGIDTKIKNVGVLDDYFNIKLSMDDEERDIHISHLEVNEVKEILLTAQMDQPGNYTVKVNSLPVGDLRVLNTSTITDKTKEGGGGGNKSENESNTSNNTTNESISNNNNTVGASTQIEIVNGALNTSTINASGGIQVLGVARHLSGNVAEFNIELYIGQRKASEKTVFMEKGETAQVLFNESVSEPGNYTIKLNDYTVDTLQVKPRPSSTGNNDANTSISGGLIPSEGLPMPGFMAVTGVLAAILLVVAFLNRRKENH